MALTICFDACMLYQPNTATVAAPACDTGNQELPRRRRAVQSGRGGRASYLSLKSSPDHPAGVFMHRLTVSKEANVNSA